MYSVVSRNIICTIVYPARTRTIYGSVLAYSLLGAAVRLVVIKIMIVTSRCIIMVARKTMLIGTCYRRVRGIYMKQVVPKHQFRTPYVNYIISPLYPFIDYLQAAVHNVLHIIVMVVGRYSIILYSYILYRHVYNV